MCGEVHGLGSKPSENNGGLAHGAMLTLTIALVFAE
jgi:hypothetical protein